MTAIVVALFIASLFGLARIAEVAGDIRSDHRYRARRQRLNERKP